MAEILTDDEIEDLIGEMWSITVDDKGVPYRAATTQGQMALDIVSKIIAGVLVLKIKPGNGEVVSLDSRRPPKD